MDCIVRGVAKSWRRLSDFCFLSIYLLDLAGLYVFCWVSQMAPVLKNLPANAGDIRDTGLIPELERSPEEGNGYPFHYSCLENSW